jgi:hypothetical protein
MLAQVVRSRRAWTFAAAAVLVALLLYLRWRARRAGQPSPWIEDGVPRSPSPPQPSLLVGDTKSAKALRVGDADPKALRVGDADPKALRVGDADPKALRVGDADPKALRVVDADPKALRVGDADPKALRVGDADPNQNGDGDPPSLRSGRSPSPTQRPRPARPPAGDFTGEDDSHTTDSELGVRNVPK